MIIKSISYSQNEIINSIINLYCSNGIDIDVTYSKGNFYKNDIPEPKYKVDIDPKYKDVIKADSRNLPFENERFSSIMFDPPFLATTGKSLLKNDGNNIIGKRFGVYPNEQALHEFYYESLVELYRVCRKNGFLIFKCQDKVSSGIQYFSHCFIYEKAVEIGWYSRDLFILLAKNRVIANWQRNQKHSRKFHSYFWVFQKNTKKSRF